MEANGGSEVLDDRDFVLAAVGFEAVGRMKEVSEPVRPPDLVVFSATTGGGIARLGKIADGFGCVAVVWGAEFQPYLTVGGNDVVPAAPKPAEFARVALDEPDCIPLTSLVVTASPVQEPMRAFVVHVGQDVPVGHADAWLRPTPCPSPFPRFFVCKPRPPSPSERDEGLRASEIWVNNH